MQCAVLPGSGLMCIFILWEVGQHSKKGLRGSTYQYLVDTHLNSTNKVRFIVNPPNLNPSSHSQKKY